MEQQIILPCMIKGDCCVEIELNRVKIKGPKCGAEGRKKHLLKKLEDEKDNSESWAQKQVNN